MHKDRPLSRTLIPILSAIYVVSPIDLVPDVVPVIGWIDDILAIVIGVRSLLAKRQ